MAGGDDRAAGLPGGLEVRAFDEASQAQDVLSAVAAPEHAGLFEPPPDDALASGFDHTAANEVSLLPEVSVTGALGVGGKVGDFAPCDVLLFLVKVRRTFQQFLGLGDDAPSIAAFEFQGPDALLGCAEVTVAIQRLHQHTEVFDSVIEVEYLDGGGEEEPGIFPDPGGTIAEKDDVSGARFRCQTICRDCSWMMGLTRIRSRSD